MSDYWHDSPHGIRQRTIEKEGDRRPAHPDPSKRQISQRLVVEWRRKLRHFIDIGAPAVIGSFYQKDAVRLCEYLSKVASEATALRIEVQKHLRQQNQIVDSEGYVWEIIGTGDEDGKVRCRRPPKGIWHYDFNSITQTPERLEIVAALRARLTR